jgi:NAD(P)-dependent dehydrogenase (short-subunit alcohol dehydrogenase family)
MRAVALITGSSRGIGRGIALELAARGRHDLMIHYGSNEAAANETRNACAAAGGASARIEIVQGDIAIEADRQRVVDAVRDRFGRLDLLVNNAGVAPEVRADLIEENEQSFDRVIAINLKGPFFLTQRATPLMMASPPIDKLPRAVVNVSSISAFTASTNRGSYCISKAGVAMMTQLFAVRLASAGIGVFEVQPGVIETDMTAGVKAKYDALFAGGFVPINRWGTPGDVARCIAAVALGEFPYATGQVFHIDGGFHIRAL